MFGPPSSPPLSHNTDARTAAAGLLPAFTPHSSSPQPAREFLRPKFAIYRDPEPQPQSAFLPTPLPTSEAHIPASSSPPASPIRSAPRRSPSEQAKPLQQLIVARVPLNGATVTIGRSSKSSTFALRTNNRLASRVHAQLSVSAENFVVIECLGWNGLTVSVPEEEAGKRQQYDVARGQILNVERTDGITVDVHGDKVLVELVNDAEETEEESWKHSEGVVSPPKKARKLDVEPCAHSGESKEGMTQGDNAGSERDAHTGWHQITEKAAEKTMAKDPTLSVPLAAKEEESPQKATLGAPLEVATTAVEVPRVQESEAAATGLAVASTSGPESVREQTPEPLQGAAMLVDSAQDTPLAIGEKRKRRLELSIDARDELENVAANFIAFSRLSAVPLAAVRKASTQLQALPKSQVRELIRDIKCVGVTEAERDDSGRLPDDEYYYIPELDADESRRAIVQTTRGHRSLRSCRKTHKQYFYRPLNLKE